MHIKYGFYMWKQCAVLEWSENTRNYPKYQDKTLTEKIGFVLQMNNSFIQVFKIYPLQK